MNPSERQREFRERLRQRDPKLAEKYGKFRGLKNRYYTAAYAHDVLTYQELKGYIEKFGTDTHRGLDAYAEKVGTEVHLPEWMSDARQIASLWIGYKREKLKQPDCILPLEIIGIRNLDDLIEVHNEFGRVLQDKKESGLVARDDFSFGKFLKRKLMEATLDPQICERDYTELFKSYHLFVDLDQMGTDDTGFYFDQYVRLERERQIGPQSEALFLPLLKNAASFSRNAGPLTLISNIINSVEANVRLTLDEIKDAVTICPDDIWGEFTEPDPEDDNPEEGISKYNAIEGLAVVFSKAELEECGQSKVGNLIQDTINDIDIVMSVQQAVDVYFGVLKDGLRLAERKIRESEKDLVSRSMDAPPELSAIFKEKAARNRMAVYLLNTYRRHRQEIDELMEGD